MRFFALFLAVFAAICLTSCTGTKNDYVRGAGEINGLVVPSDVPPIKQEPYYPVPAMPANASTAKSVSTLPPTLQSGNSH